MGCFCVVLRRLEILQVPIGSRRGQPRSELDIRLGYSGREGGLVFLQHCLVLGDPDLVSFISLILRPPHQEI